ncbi:MAG: signal peptidase II [Bacteroidota bacterium]
MKAISWFRIVTILSIILANIGCDQVSKTIVRENVDFREHISIIDDHFILTKDENTGAFLSFGSDFPPALRMFLLIFLPTLVLIFALKLVLTDQKFTRGTLLGLCFMIGGGIGNMIDRVMYGSVTDFLHIDLGIVRTGVFNMADVSITIGAILMLVFFPINSKQAEETETPETPQEEASAEPSDADTPQS